MRRTLATIIVAAVLYYGALYIDALTYRIRQRNMILDRTQLRTMGFADNVVQADHRSAARVTRL